MPSNERKRSYNQQNSLRLSEQKSQNKHIPLVRQRGQEKTTDEVCKLDMTEHRMTTMGTWGMLGEK